MREFNRNKSAISWSLSQLEEKGIIIKRSIKDHKKDDYRIIIKLTKSGFLLTTAIINQALSEKEIMVLKALNVGKT